MFRHFEPVWPACDMRLSSRSLAGCFLILSLVLAALIDLRTAESKGDHGGHNGGHGAKPVSFYLVQTGSTFACRRFYGPNGTGKAFSSMGECQKSLAQGSGQRKQTVTA